MHTMSTALNLTPDLTPAEARAALQAAINGLRAADSAVPADLPAWSRATRQVRTAMLAASKVLDEHELRRWRGVVADVRESTPLECALWPLAETLPETDAELLEQLRQLDACPCGGHWPDMVGKVIGLPRQYLRGSAPNGPSPTAVEALLRSQTVRNVRTAESGEELAEELGEMAEDAEGVEFEVVTELGEVAYGAARDFDKAHGGDRVWPEWSELGGEQHSVWGAVAAAVLEHR